MSLLQDPKVYSVDSDWNTGDSGEVTWERLETKSWIIPSHALSNLNEFLRHLRRYGHRARKAMDFVPCGAASSLMDMIQLHLDGADSHEDRSLRRACIHCLLRLNKRHFSLPTSLHLVDVVKEGSHPVAGGGFADIWKGRLKVDRLVCLKVLRVYTGSFDMNKLMKQLGNEVLIWRQLRHPNIDEFLGVTSELFEPSYCIVSPWMANGDVMSYCRERNSSLEVKIAMMREFCDGLRYLHEYNPPIIHSDIKGMNILVSDDGHCRISDFGLSTIENDSPEGRVSDSTSQAAMRGSIPWLAPELMNPSSVESPNRTTRDIYALGCTMYEVRKHLRFCVAYMKLTVPKILAGSPPFSDKKMDPHIMIAVLSGMRPTRPAGCPDHLWTIIEKCWTEDSGSRLVASEVVALLSEPTLLTLSSPTNTSVINAEVEYMDRLSEGIQFGRADWEPHPHVRDPQFKGKNPLPAGSTPPGMSQDEGVRLVDSTRRRGIDEVDSPTESDTPVKRPHGRFRPRLTPSSAESVHRRPLGGRSSASVQRRHQPPLLPPSNANNSTTYVVEKGPEPTSVKAPSDSPPIHPTASSHSVSSATPLPPTLAHLPPSWQYDDYFCGSDDDITLYQCGLGSLSSEPRGSQRLAGNSATRDSASRSAEPHTANRRHTGAATLSFRSDSPPGDPIWNYISVRDAWKSFRLRVGTSELAGVLPSSYRV
ncbi:Homeobox protein tos8 [Marasmius sp. AFHP31]|nr:Homeobox protein tos8 [Marasmius sp. AFHP31]